MFGRFLRGTEWAEITDYLSPVFFQIIPPLALARAFKELTSSYLDKKSFASVRQECGVKLLPLGLPPPEAKPDKSDVPVRANPATDAASTAAQQKARGETVLGLYFAQLLLSETVILDLRSSAFSPTPSATGDKLKWQPSPLYIHYDHEFISQIRKLYIGFYLGKGDMFDEALTAMELTGAKSLFIKHFGVDQSSQSFDLADFRSTFHSIFLVCKETKAHLHPNFLAFGSGLFCLYEHLQTLGQHYDVRSAFFKVYEAGNPAPAGAKL